MRATALTAGRRGRSGPVIGLVVALLLTAAGAGVAAAAERPAPVDLNSAPLEEVLALPVPPEVAQAIVNYRTYRRFFGDVYELREVDGVTPEIFALLKPLVSTMPPADEDASIARLSASYRQMQRYLGQEGSNEGLADEYLDKMRSPENVNEADLFDLMSYQNVSPVDATNILKARDRLGRFEGQRQLRRSEGVRYWAYRNLRDFVVYSPEEMKSSRGGRVTGYFQTRYHETPYSNDDDELGGFAVRSSGVRTRYRYLTGDIKPFNPGWMNKIRISTEEGITAGLLTNREYGEQTWNETTKGYLGLHDRQWGQVRLKSLYVGNFRAAYGLGLVMDNTDYIHYRKTGYGFNKRLLGIHGDLSRSYEYHLSGVAAEASAGPVHFSGFYSSTKKDGILNPDGTINRHVTMQPRLDADYLESRMVPQDYQDPQNTLLPSYMRRQAIEEDLLGGNVKYMFAPGTYLGLTGFEARYNRGWNPDETTLLAKRTIDDELVQARDSEISNSYRSVFTNPDSTVTEYKWRRVMGAEGQAVVGNVALQGEYAFVQDPRETFFSAKNPDAYIFNAYAQWENFHLLAIYRDYDVGFDNPYNRAFSNDNRYEQTLLDAPYRLKDDLYAWLESTTPLPNPEKGIFLETRYRVSRQFTISGLQFDQWQRKADGADLMRYTLKMEYQPIFNLRFRVRHRYSSRSEANPEDVRTYQNWETRWQLIGMLSNYNRIGLTYMTSNVWFPARARLSGPQDVAGDAKVGVGLRADPSQAFEMRYEHYLTPGLKLTLASSVYNGFLWNFEGNEFVLLDGNGFRNWFKVESRVSERLLFQLKITRDHNLPKTWVDIRRYGDTPAGNEPDADYVPADDTIVRLQMDYTF